MSVRATIVMTGSTGYVGRHLLAALLREGYRVVAIVRRRNGRLQRRLADLLAPFGHHGLERLVVVEGDLRAELCGVARPARSEIRRMQPLALLHSAGLTRFDAHLADELEQHNVEGVRQALGLCGALGIPEFHHLSTAFVAGTADSLWREEDLARGQGFRNPYERSKFRAETLLRASHAEDAPRIAIYRPSIVVGGQAVGEGGTTSTVYTFLKTLHFLRECCRRDMVEGRRRLAALGVSLQGEAVHVPMRLAADPQARINLVSIEQLVDAIASRIGRLSSACRTHHVIGQDFDLETVRQRFCHGMEVSGLRYVMESVFAQQPRNSLEERFHRATRVYQPYLHAAPRFAAGREADRGEPVDLARLVREFRVQIDARGGHSDSLGSMSLACLGVDSAQHYFERMIERDFGSDFLSRWRDMDTCIRFTVRGARPFDRTIRFADERACFTRHAAAVCRYEMDEETFQQITCNRLDPRQAFFSGRVTIGGDKEAGLKFAFFLSDYLRQVDEHVITELSGAC